MVTGLQTDDESSMIAVTLIDCYLIVLVMLKHPLLSVVVKGRTRCGNGEATKKLVFSVATARLPPLYKTMRRLNNVTTFPWKRISIAE